MKKLALIVATTVLSVNVAQAKLICHQDGYTESHVCESQKLKCYRIKLPRITCINIESKFPKKIQDLLGSRYAESQLLKESVLEVDETTIKDLSKQLGIDVQEIPQTQLTDKVELNIDGMSINGTNYSTKGQMRRAAVIDAVVGKLNSSTTVVDGRQELTPSRKFETEHRGALPRPNTTIRDY